MESHMNEYGQHRTEIKEEEEKEVGEKEVYTLLDAAGECQSLDASIISRLCRIILTHSTAIPLVTGWYYLARVSESKKV